MKVAQVARLGLLRLQAPQQSKSLSSKAQTNCSQASHGVLQDVCIVGWSTEWEIDHWLALYLYRLFLGLPADMASPVYREVGINWCSPFLWSFIYRSKAGLFCKFGGILKAGIVLSPRPLIYVETTGRPPVWLVSDYLSTLWSNTLSVLTV